MWLLPHDLPGSAHSFKYRLAYVVDDVCVFVTTMRPAKATIGTLARSRRPTGFQPSIS